MDNEPIAEVGPLKPATARLTRNFLIIAVALLLLKLFLVSQREMVTEDHDAYEYVRVSLEDLRSIFAGDGWGHEPGASLIIALARSLGIPYRVFVEVFLAIAAFVFFRPLAVSMRLGIAAATVCYGLLLFHPALILGLDHAMSDSVNFFCWLIGAGGIMGFVAAPRGKFPWVSLVLAIVGFAFAGITRSGEGAIVFAEMVAIALLSIPLFRGADNWRRRRAIVACVCALVANLAAVQALSAWHSVRSGYWGATAVQSREWLQLYGILLSLPVERAQRHALVNKATMDMAESFSGDLRDMSACFDQLGYDFREQPPNDGASWAITICLPEKGSPKSFAGLRKISADILKGAQEEQLQLTAPILGIIPRPATRWLPELPSSMIKVASESVRIPGSTRVQQNSFDADIFDQALLRRAALMSAGENPEVLGYRSFIRPLYELTSALFWPLVPLAFLIVAIVAWSAGTAVKLALPAFLLAIVTIDVLCRISFYSVVDWILWDIQSRYILGASALTVVVVAMLFAVWVAPWAAAALRPWLIKLPGLPAWAENIGRPRHRA